MSGFGSHLKVIEDLFDKHEIKTVLEYGMGFNSTGLFIDRAEKVYSIEQQEEQWYNKVVDKYKHEVGKKFIPFMEKDYKKCLEYVDSINETIDLIFVDGCVEGRVPEIHHAYSKTKLIVTHDTESRAIKVYGWDTLKIENGWSRTDYPTFPQTTVIRI